MKSTVPPGVGQTILQQDLKGLGVNYVANPEFIREGRALEDWQLPDRIVVGTEPGDERSVEAVREMYSTVNAPYLLTDITSAEMIKYASNGFLATRISFINEIASLCDRVGASVDAVSKGIAMDARTGSQIHAGIGYGGSCLPKDIRVLNRIALENELDAPLLRSVVEVNDRQRLLPLEMLRRRFGETIAGLNVGVLGLAFKPGTNDVRDAPSLTLIKALVNDGAMVRAFDPQANESAKGLLPSTVEFADSPAAASHGAQALVLLTEWADIVNADWKTIAKGMRYPKFVFDGRNALDPAVMVHLGFEYTGVGRGDAGTLNDGTRLAG
jgi:UDPglucose 6-dehydrogenase